MWGYDEIRLESRKKGFKHRHGNEHAESRSSEFWKRTLSKRNLGSREEVQVVQKVSVTSFLPLWIEDYEFEVMKRTFDIFEIFIKFNTCSQSNST